MGAEGLHIRCTKLHTRLEVLSGAVSLQNTLKRFRLCV